MSLFSRERYADGDHLTVAGSPVRLKVQPRSSRVSLRIDRSRREVIASAPSAKRLQEAVLFAGERAAWIAERLARIPTAPSLDELEFIRLFGEPYRLEREGLRAKLIPANDEDPARLVLPADPDRAPGALARLVKKHAHEVLAARTAIYCGRLDQPLPAITVADAKSRWGSCRKAGAGRAAAIRYNWRLALAPFAVADYVCAHECAHLIEANHGPKFWGLVKQLNGDHAPHRAWLKAHGDELHAFGR